jgi:hypothetical protein
MTIPYQVIFAYGVTSDVSLATIGTYTIVWAKATSVINSVYHTLVDYSIAKDQVSKLLRLQFKIGKTILCNPTDRAFFKAFFEAPCKWAVYGDFKDTNNGSYYNLCLCDVPNDFNQLGNGNIVDVSMEQDQSGYILISNGVSSSMGSSHYLLIDTSHYLKIDSA